MGGAGSGGGWVSRNDVVLTPAVHVDVVGLRPVLWAVERCAGPRLPLCRSRCWLCRSRPAAGRRGGADHRPVDRDRGTQSGASSISVGSWPGVGCEIVAGVRAAGVTRGWGRTKPEPGGPHPDPFPSRCRHPGAGEPERGREAWGLTRTSLGDPSRPVPGWGQPAGGGGVSVWSYFSRRSLIARCVTPSHMAIRYMEIPAARAAMSSEVTSAEASPRARFANR